VSEQDTCALAASRFACHQPGGASVKTRNILAVLFFVLTIYSFAGGTLLGIVNYPTWRSFNATEFPAVHQAVNKPITVFFVPFFSLCVLVNILLIWFHPPAMSTLWVGVTAALNLFIWTVTVTLAIPIHKQLDHAKSVELIDKLIVYHLYLRVIPGLMLMLITGVLLYQVVRASSA
jgi:phosphate starvation-inducible membrane PsiE